MKRARLQPREERRLLRGHRWAFRNEFEEIPPLEDGAVLDVLSAEGRFVGRGFYQAQGGIAVRILSRRETPIDETFFAESIERAQQYRERLFPDETSYRWVYAESDGLPGLVADRYGAAVCVQSSCAFYEQHAESLAGAFLGRAGVESVRIQVCGRERTFGAPFSMVEARFDGVHLCVDAAGGQKTGMFLDQRENARAARRLASGARVLDGHCYIGLWSVHAALGGAREVLGVDSSEAAIQAARENAQRNGVAAVCSFACEDIADTLRRAEGYDVVFLDPPALAKSRGARDNALGMYQALNRDAFRAVERGGYLVTSACSHQVSRTDFLDMLKRAARSAQREAWLVDVRGPAPDHPVLLAMPETDYLTCATLRVL